MRRHGDKNFTWLVLETCSSLADLNAAEVRWMAKLGCMHPVGYNLIEGGLNGRTVPPELSAKWGKMQRGKVCSEETRQKIAASLRARYATDGFDKARALKISEAVKACGKRKPQPNLYVLENLVTGEVVTTHNLTQFAAERSIPRHVFKHALRYTPLRGARVLTRTWKVTKHARLATA